MPMSECMGGMMTVMMAGGALILLLVIAILVLGVLALVKYLRRLG